MTLPRFSLRELFLLVVIAAMGCGWWVHYRTMQRELDQYHDAARKLAVTELALRSVGFYVNEVGKVQTLNLKAAAKK